MSSCPSEAEPDYCSLVLANPDISGIGVRIAVYVQVGLNVLASTLLQSNLQLTRNAARTSYVLSLSLILASIMQWRIGGMGLFDALVGLQLATLLTVFVLFNIRYINSLGLSINISSTLFLILYTYWGIQTWAFPSCPSNALTQFVVFGKSISATNPGLRIFALVVFSLVGLLTLFAVVLLLAWAADVWLHGGEVKARNARVRQNVQRERYGIDTGAGKSRITSLLPLSIMIYLVVSTEQLVARNNLPNLDEWSYGQTLAVVMLLSQFVEMGLWVWKEKRSMREMKWRGRSGTKGLGLPLV
ncbi:hypothetical protein B0J17DRAFT_667038 [Rhizoctonia solani]|nr:hypothetical protein B0J17DRAFT_667038 [Rhizoctonia solani]